jgi:hypothetical protein
MASFKTLVLAMAMMAAPGMGTGQAAEGGYAATLATAAPGDRLVAHGLLWRCDGARCAAPTGNSRPLIVCQALAKAAGPVTSFANGAKALDAGQLARCNGPAGQERVATAR